jgi:hypothetical protein
MTYISNNFSVARAAIVMGLICVVGSVSNGSQVVNEVFLLAHKDVTVIELFCCGEV